MDGTKRLRGSMTALVTPFCDGEVDWPRLEALVDRQIEAGTDWLVVCGTTGESPTLTVEEHERMVDAVVARSAGRCQVMAGTGTNDTSTTIRLTRTTASRGAEAVLVVTPYYNRPTQEGLYRHFAAVAESVKLPIVLYNVPLRTGVDLLNDTVVRLRDAFPHIVAIKDATGSVDRATDLMTRCDIAVLSGDDALTWPLLALGAVGVISVIANLVPSLMKSLVTAALEGDASSAQRVHRKVYDLATGLGRFGPNPVPIKTAMAVVGWIKEEFRLPLCPLDGEARADLERVLRRHEILTQTAI